MMQTNLASGFERKVCREELAPSRLLKPPHAVAGGACRLEGRVSVAAASAGIVLRGIEQQLLGLLERTVDERRVRSISSALLPCLLAEADSHLVVAETVPSGLSGGSTVPACGRDSGSLECTLDIIIRGGPDLVAECEAALLREILRRGSGAGQVGAACQPPLEWAPMTEGVNLALVDVPEGSREMDTVRGKLLATVPSAKVVLLQRVQNRWLWEAFSFQRRRMAAAAGSDWDPAAGERELFHGTSKNDPRLVYDGREGFDPRSARALRCPQAMMTSTSRFAGSRVRACGARASTSPQAPPTRTAAMPLRPALCAAKRAASSFYWRLCWLGMQLACPAINLCSSPR